MAQCTAKSKRSGQRCKRHARPGRSVCVMHGGKAPAAGPTHPTFKHGRYSKALGGTTIQEQYEKARTDPHLLALTEDIALLVAKQQETISRLSTGESAPSWERLAHLVSLAEDAGMGTPQFSAVWGAIREMVTNALSDEAVWEEYTERAEQIRKLVDTERKYQEGLRLYLPLDRANAIMNVWLDCIRRVVPRQYIAQLHEEFQKHRPQTLIGNGREVGAQ